MPIWANIGFSIYLFLLCAVLIITLATCSYLLLSEWPSYGIELTRLCCLEGNFSSVPCFYSQRKCICIVELERKSY